MSQLCLVIKMSKLEKDNSAEYHRVSTPLSLLNEVRRLAQRITLRYIWLFTFHRCVSSILRSERAFQSTTNPVPVASCGLPWRLDSSVYRFLSSPSATNHSARAFPVSIRRKFHFSISSAFSLWWLGTRSICSASLTDLSFHRRPNSCSWHDKSVCKSFSSIKTAYDRLLEQRLKRTDSSDVRFSTYELLYCELLGGFWIDDQEYHHHCSVSQVFNIKHFKARLRLVFGRLKIYPWTGISSREHKYQQRRNNRWYSSTTFDIIKSMLPKRVD